MKRRKSHRPLRVESLEARLNLAYVVDLSIDEDDGNYGEGDLSLREAVRLANENPAEDTITFAPNMTTVSLTDGTLTLTDSAKTIINGGTGVIVERDTNAIDFGIIHITTDGTAELSGLTIRNGTSTSGGGVFNQGTLQIHNSVFSGNRALGSGGAIHNEGSLTIHASQFLQNSVTGISNVPMTPRGGTVTNLGEMSMYDSAFEASGVFVTDERGGIYKGFGGGVFNSGTLTISRSSISNSSVYGNGGGICNTGNIAVFNSTVDRNYNYDAGGYINELGGNLGGGVFNAGLAKFVNSTIVQNQVREYDNLTSTVTNGGGIWTADESAAATELFNSIVSGNWWELSQFYGYIRSGTNDIAGKNVEATSSYNLFGSLDTAGGLTDGSNGNKYQDGFDAERVAVNGVVYYRPVAHSRALNGGSNDNVLADMLTDVRGEGFSRILNGTVDIGAVENYIPSSPYIVDLSSYDYDADFSTGDLSFLEALVLADTQQGAQTITFADGITNVPLPVASLDGTDSTNILGRGVVLEARWNYGITISSRSNLTLNDLILRPSVPGPIYRPIIVSSGTFTMNNSTVAGFHTVSGNEFPGTAIWNEGGTVNINDSTIFGNSSDAFGAIASFGTLNIAGSTITGNSATLDGGGIIADGTVTVTNSIISGNSSDQNGGGIWFANGTLTIVNSTITNNRADADGNNPAAEIGGGIMIYDGSVPTQVIIRNSIVAGNFVGTESVGSDLAGNIAVISGSHNLIGDAASAGGLQNGVNGNIVGVDPLLGPLQNNGGPTFTHALLPGSPAINAGDNSLAVDGQGNPLTTDQRGTGFSRILGGTVDIGAVETTASAPTVDLLPNLTTPSSDQALTISVNLTGSPIPTGTVTLYVNNVAGIPASLVGGQVQVTLNGLPVGLHTIFARYSGDPNYNSVDSAVLNQQVFPQSDVNRSGAVEINDILAAIFMFNTYATPIAVANLPAGPPFPDASGDGQFDINDLLRIIFDFNQTLVNPEGETAPSPSSSTPTSASTSVAVDEVFADDAAWLWDTLPTTRRRSRL